MSQFRCNGIALFRLDLAPDSLESQKLNVIGYFNA